MGDIVWTSSNRDLGNVEYCSFTKGPDLVDDLVLLLNLDSPLDMNMSSSMLGSVFFGRLFLRLRLHGQPNRSVVCRLDSLLEKTCESFAILIHHGLHRTVINQ